MGIIHEKLGKKCYGKFCWSYGGHTKNDYFTKNGPKSSILRIFHRGMTQNDEI
jgi:hypothetical protein